MRKLWYASLIGLALLIAFLDRVDMLNGTRYYRAAARDAIGHLVASVNGYGEVHWYRIAVHSYNREGGAPFLSDAIVEEMERKLRASEYNVFNRKDRPWGRVFNDVRREQDFLDNFEFAAQNDPAYAEVQAFMCVFPLTNSWRRDGSRVSVELAARLTSRHSQQLLWSDHKTGQHELARHEGLLLDFAESHYRPYAVGALCALLIASMLRNTAKDVRKRL